MYRRAGYTPGYRAGSPGRGAPCSLTTEAHTAAAALLQSFPKGEKYVALFAQGGDEAHAVAERTRLRALIKARVYPPPCVYPVARAVRPTSHPSVPSLQANLAAAAVLAEADEGACILASCSLRVLRRVLCAGGAELELGAGEDEDEGEDEFFLGEGGQGGAAWGEDAFFQSPHQPTAPPVPAPPLCFADALTRRGSKQPTKAAPKDAGGRAAPPRVRPGGGGGGGGDAAPSQGAGKRGRPAAEDFAWKKQKRPASASVAPTHPGAAAPTAAAARRVHVRFDGGEAPQAAPPARAPPPPAAAAAPLRPPAKAKAEAKAPLRSRAEGGRKRRSKK